MNGVDLASYIDSTNLKADARQADLEALCQEASQYHLAAVCVHPYRISLCRRLLTGTAVKLCTVVGFPLGADGLTGKSCLAAWSLDQGADELDMVINIGACKDGNYQTVRQEIEAVAALKQKQPFILKVIVETGLLDNNQLGAVAGVINQTEADFVKTSTGFGPRGASLDDIAQLMQYKRPSLKIKASGGIRDLAFALALIEAGADRIGTSNAGQLLRSYPTTCEK